MLELEKNKVWDIVEMLKETSLSIPSRALLSNTCQANLLNITKQG